MKQMKLWLGSCLLAAGVACGDYAGGKQAGSATDVSKNGELPSNPANVADNGLGGPAQRESGNYQRPLVSGQAADEELAKKVKVALTTGSTGTTGAIAENQLTKIDVQVRDGVVTLSGPVATEAEKASIGKQVARFEGVKGVVNNLSAGGRIVQDKPLEPLVPRSTGNE